MAAETEASTILWTSAAVSCPWAASRTDLAIDASNSPLVGTLWVAPVTAASTILAISAELTPSGTELVTACSTSGLITSVSSLGAGMAEIAASTTFLTSAAVICSPAWALMAASRSALETPGPDATAACTICWISLGSVAAGTEADTASLTIAAISDAGTGVGAVSAAPQPRATPRSTESSQMGATLRPFRDNIISLLEIRRIRPFPGRILPF